MSRPCRYATQCNNQSCPFDHSTDNQQNRELRPVNRGPVPCRFGVKCNNDNCKFDHQQIHRDTTGMTQQLDGLQQQPNTHSVHRNTEGPSQSDVSCKFGFRCNNNACRFAHPERTGAFHDVGALVRSKPIAIFPTQPIKRNPMPCRFGEHCTNKNCTYEHNNIENRISRSNNLPENLQDGRRIMVNTGRNTSHVNTEGVNTGRNTSHVNTEGVNTGRNTSHVNTEGVNTGRNTSHVNTEGVNTGRNTEGIAKPNRNTRDERNYYPANTEPLDNVFQETPCKYGNHCKNMHCQYDHNLTIMKRDLGQLCEDISSSHISQSRELFHKMESEEPSKDRRDKKAHKKSHKTSSDEKTKKGSKTTYTIELSDDSFSDHEYDEPQKKKSSTKK